jgi:hypothetical protein
MTYYISERREKKSNKITLYLLFLYIIIAIYIIPYGTVPHAKIFYPFISSFVFITSYAFHEKYNLKEILFFLLLFMLVFINFSYSKLVSSVTLILIYIIKKRKTNINKKFIKTLYWISLVSIAVQLLTYRYHGYTTRIVLSPIDPNISGHFMLLYFYFSNKNKFYLGIILSLLCIPLFLSRNYFLAIIIFYLIKVLKVKLDKIMKKIRFEHLFIILNLSLIFLSFFWIKEIGTQENFFYKSKELLRLIDNSNYMRFFANYRVINYFINDLYLFLFGFGNNFEAFFLKPNEWWTVLPHSSFIYFIAKNGFLFSSLYFFSLSKYINKFFTYKNYEYIYSYLIFSLFLYGAFSGVEIIFLFFILIMDY